MFAMASTHSLSYIMNMARQIVPPYMFSILMDRVRLTPSQGSQLTASLTAKSEPISFMARKSVISRRPDLKDAKVYLATLAKLLLHR